MKSRAIEPCPIVRSRKIPPPVTKVSPPPVRETRAATSKSKSEGYHKTCVSQPSTGSPLKTASKVLPPPKKPLDKKVSPPPVVQQKLTVSPPPRPVSSKPVPASVSKVSVAKRVSSKKVSVAPKQPKVPVEPSRLEVSLSKEDLRLLVDKFQEVRSSVVQVAASKRPVEARSLEALLNLEISRGLGDSLNNQAFSQAFVQATRNLLEELIRLYEEGKLNPKLLQKGGKQNKPFLRANPATTVCYRDQYFKELVMNILQSMTSSDIEEEVAGKAVRSEESKERIRNIRDMVRTEAGLEPENFRDLERRLEELRRSLSRNKIEMEKAASEVDQIISDHIVQEKQSLRSLQIPKSARDVWRTSRRLESGRDDVGTCKDGVGCCEPVSCSTSVAGDGSEQYKKSLDTVGVKESFEKGNSDEIHNIRPQLKQLFQEELLRIKMKEADILNRDREFDRRLGPTPKSSIESVEFNSAKSNASADDEDNINEEETRNFIEDLKAEIEERKINEKELLRNCVPQGVSINVLERIDEEREISHRETTDEISSSTTRESRISSHSLTTSNTGLEPLKCTNEIVVGIASHSNTNLEVKTSGKNCAKQVQSKWAFQEDSDVKDFLWEMKDAFETFEAISDVFSAFKVSEDCKNKTGDADEARRSNENCSINILDSTIQEVANVLVNVAVKMNDLPKYMQDKSSNEFSEQIKEAEGILPVLSKIMNASNTKGHEALDQAPLTIEDIAKTFSFLSKALSSSSNEMEDEPISVLSPPKSLIDALFTLSSTAYFKDCFLTIKASQCKQTEAKRSIEIVKSYNLSENKSSAQVLHFDFRNLKENPSDCRRKMYSYTRDIKHPDDLYKNLERFEQYKGLSTSAMTIQDVSDMFLFLSAVLNDVPDRIKSEKILDLDPPSSILQSLDILYCDNDMFGSLTDLEKKKSFASLTLQNVSDCFLTFSKAFDDFPERLKNSTVADLKPPQSLLRAISVLTSLSRISIPEGQETIEEVDESSENNESFYDAVTSLSSMG